jgi:hypothetical protein
MTRRETLAYVLRHSWLWPLAFCARPLAWARELNIEGRAGAVIWSASLGAGLSLSLALALSLSLSS